VTKVATHSGDKGITHRHHAKKDMGLTSEWWQTSGSSFLHGNIQFTEPDLTWAYLWQRSPRSRWANQTGLVLGRTRMGAPTCRFRHEKTPNLQPSKVRRGTPKTNHKSGNARKQATGNDMEIDIGGCDVQSDQRGNALLTGNTGQANSKAIR
jgi:hypothetical protein